MYPDPSSVTRVTTLGAGPIGGGWAAHFLARGYDVTAYIHSEAERPALMAVIDTGWISLKALGLAEGASRDRLVVTTDLDAAVRDAQFIQESAPERLELKQALYRRLGEVAPKDCVIASSTSGLMMTDIQKDCPTPERTVIGHPFNPPYLLPLVEIIGGKKTNPAAVGWAAAFYRHAGKAPLVMKKEIPGFVATRLQEALWREALHMVANGEATPEDIDLALMNGPGAAHGGAGAMHGLPRRLRRGRHGHKSRPVRPGAQMALDPAGGARIDARAARPHGRRLQRHRRRTAFRGYGSPARPRDRRRPESDQGGTGMRHPPWRRMLPAVAMAPLRSKAGGGPDRTRVSVVHLPSCH